MKIIKYYINGIYIIIKLLCSIVIRFFVGVFIVITIFPKYFIKGIIYLFSKDKNKIKTKKEKGKIPFIMAILSLAVYFICVFIFSKWYVQCLKNDYLSNDIIKSTQLIVKEEQNILDDYDKDLNANSTNYYPNDWWNYISIPFLEVNFDELLKTNNRTVGWLNVPNTNANYPIVRGDDNDYYLHHSFDNSYNYNGWIFADFRVSFSNFKRNTIIYGHNMTNRTMFGSLIWLLRGDWFSNQDNLYIKISTPNSNSVWKIFSVYTIEPEVYYLKTAFTDDTYKEWLNTISSRNIQNIDNSVTADDKVLTLSTCDDTGTKRIVTHAKMVNIEYR